MIGRRRVLALMAGFAAFPAFAATPLRWRGVALGADASLVLSAPPRQARAALDAALAAIEAVEATFSLYRPDSVVVRLNRDGRTATVPDLFRGLHAAVTDLHDRTGGLFDPTVQPSWTAMARGEGGQAWLHGWDRVRLSGDGVRLGAGQQVTFNGIAQGFATDLVVAALRHHGLTDAFVNIGEQAAMGAPRRLGVVDPVHGLLGQLTLRGGAVATSSPASTPLGAIGHILDPRDPATRPRWSTVSVEAENATLADGLSTALVHADLAQARSLRGTPGVRRILLADGQGNVRTL